jgi:hypothetical protein
MLIRLNEQERDALRVVLTLALRNLREEIHITETAECRQLLEQRKSVLTGFLERLRTSDPLGPDAARTRESG